MSLPIYTPYSPVYRELALRAIHESQVLSFEPAPADEFVEVVSDTCLLELRKFVQQVLQPSAAAVFTGYRGNICQSMGLYMLDQLHAAGFRADLIVGEVNINGTDEYDTTIEGLRLDWKNGHDGQGSQALHVWASIGDDVIIDGGIGARLSRYYGAQPEFAEEIIVGRATYLADSMRCRYIPMMVGRAFLSRTNEAKHKRLHN
jgi:hypothetical protein